MRLKVLLVAAIFAISFLGFYSPAQAADGITPYGNIYTWGGWTNSSKERNASGKSDTDYAQGNMNPALTNIGVKGEKNGVEVRLEFGVKTDYEAFRARWAYASYKASNGLQLWFGQGLTPYQMVNPVDLRDGDAMAVAAACYDGWISQIRLHFMGAYISIMDPKGSFSEVTAPGPPPTITARGIDEVLPKVAAGYTFKTDVFSVGANVVAQQFKVDDTASTFDGEKVTSWLVNAMFKGKFGPSYVNVLGYYAINPGAMGFASLNGANNTFKIAAGEIEDTTVYGAQVAAGFKASDMFTINVGLGYEACDNDSWADKDDFLVYFANVQVFLQPNCYVAPTVKVVDYRKNQAKAKEGKVTYFGAAFVASI